MCLSRAPTSRNSREAIGVFFPTLRDLSRTVPSTSQYSSSVEPIVGTNHVRSELAIRAFHVFPSLFRFQDVRVRVDSKHDRNLRLESLWKGASAVQCRR